MRKPNGHMGHFGLKIIMLGLVVAACGTRAKEQKRNERLTYFRSWTTMDMDDLVEAGEGRYGEIESERFNPKTDTITFDNNSIYISYLAIVNGCGQYTGDIEIKSDSILLNLVDIGGVACTEERCDRLIYKIKNPGDKKYKIVKWR